MEVVKLRRAGGSLTLTIPRTLVRSLGLEEGVRLEISAEDGKLVASPAAPSPARYTLEQLLAQCDPAAALSDEDRAWLGDEPAGGELI